MNDYYREQQDLPGGSIGMPTDAGHGAQLWRHPSGAGDRVDRRLERTALRWRNGWYIVTSLKDQRTVLRREGPFGTVEAARLALERIASGKDDSWEAVQALDNRAADRIKTILHEGLAQRVQDAARSWTRSIDCEHEKLAKAGEVVGNWTQFDEGLAGKRGWETSEVAFKTLQEAVIAYRAWAESR